MSGDCLPMRILMLVRNPRITGPVVTIAPLLIQALNDLGCEVKPLFWGRQKEGENWLETVVGRAREIDQVRRELSGSRFDLLVIQTSHDWRTLGREIPLLLVCRHLCSQIVIQMHGSQSGRMVVRGHYLLKIATRSLLSMCDAVLILSREEQRQWSHFYPRIQSYAVDNPFLAMNEDPRDRLAKSWNIPESEPVILFVGRLIVEKGVYDLLEALPIILQRTKCHLIIAGEGPEKIGLSRKVDELALAHAVTLAGYLRHEELWSASERASVFVLPSYREGFPTAITEAMSFGLPIVSTKVGGIPDHLQEGINALFVRPKNPIDIANAVLRLLNDTELCEEMGRANLAKVKDFRPENVAPRYMEIFAELLIAGSPIKASAKTREM